jgi:hypothetical protein
LTSRLAGGDERDNGEVDVAVKLPKETIEEAAGLG